MKIVLTNKTISVGNKKRKLWDGVHNLFLEDRLEEDNEENNGGRREIVRFQKEINGRFMYKTCGRWQVYYFFNVTFSSVVRPKPAHSVGGVSSSVYAWRVQYCLC